MASMKRTLQCMIVAMVTLIFSSCGPKYEELILGTWNLDKLTVGQSGTEMILRPAAMQLEKMDVTFAENGKAFLTVTPEGGETAPSVSVNWTLSGKELVVSLGDELKLLLGDNLPEEFSEPMTFTILELTGKTLQGETQISINPSSFTDSEMPVQKIPMNLGLYWIK